MSDISRNQLINHGKKATSLLSQSYPSYAILLKMKKSLITNLPQSHSHLTFSRQCPGAGRWLLEEVGDSFVKTSKGLLKSRWWTHRPSKVYHGATLPRLRGCAGHFTHIIITHQGGHDSPHFTDEETGLSQNVQTYYWEWTENGNR